MKITVSLIIKFLVFLLANIHLQSKAQEQKIQFFKEIVEGSDYSSLDGEYLELPSKNLLIFTANDGVHGRELWATDGTEEGTKMIKDIFEGIDDFDDPWDSYPEFFTLMGDFIYFRANTLNEGIELWRTDGTPEGTTLVKDLKSPGGGLSTTSLFFVFKNELYFAGQDTVTTGTELWKTDGTPDRTVLVKDINTGDKKSSVPNGFAECNGMLFFTASSYDYGSELWVTDGTSEGTYMVKDIYPGKSGAIGNKISFNNELYFVASGEYDTEIYKTDGTEEGTILLKDINSVGGGVDLNVDFEIYNNELYFAASDDNHGKELWKTDGTTEGTQLVKDINTEFNSYAESSYPAELTVFDSKLFFRATDGSNNYELWVTDGTTDGTVLFADLNDEKQSVPHYLTLFENSLYFIAVNNNMSQLFRLTSSSATLKIIECDGFDYSSSSDFGRIFTFQDHFFMQAKLEEGREWEFYTLVDSEESSIELSEQTITLSINDSQQLLAKTTPSISSLEWISTDETIATVSQNGLISALKSGETRIIARIIGTTISDTCIVTVSESLHINYIGQQQLVYLDYANKELIINIQAKSFQCEIFGFDGKQRLKWSNQLTHDISSLETGLYILRIASSEGTITQKFIWK